MSPRISGSLLPPLDRVIPLIMRTPRHGDVLLGSERKMVCSTVALQCFPINPAIFSVLRLRPDFLARVALPSGLAARWQDPCKAGWSRRSWPPPGAPIVNRHMLL